MRVTPENYRKDMGTFYEANISSIDELQSFDDSRFLNVDKLHHIEVLKYDHRQCFTDRDEALENMKQQLSQFIKTVSKKYFPDRPIELISKSIAA